MPNKTKKASLVEDNGRERWSSLGREFQSFDAKTQKAFLSYHLSSFRWQGHPKQGSKDDWNGQVGSYERRQPFRYTLQVH